MQRDLYFTATNPYHNYKSENFFDAYLAQRSRTAFGAGVNNSAYKKKILMRRFFMWYYFIPTKRFFVKIFSRAYQHQFFTFRSLGSLFHLLERNVLTLLVRAQFCPNLLQALYFVKAGFVFLNGRTLTKSFWVTRLGDCIEFLWLTSRVLSFIYQKNLLKFAHFRKRYLEERHIVTYTTNEFPHILEAPTHELFGHQHTVGFEQQWAYTRALNYIMEHSTQGREENRQILQS